MNIIEGEFSKSHEEIGRNEIKLITWRGSYRGKLL